MERGNYNCYLDNAYEAYSMINTMVTNDNKRHLKEIYVPLTLTRDPKTKLMDKIVVDGFPSELNHAGKKVLIVDRAGMGKSTLVKRIFVDLYENDGYIPLFVELRRIVEYEDLKSFICNMLSLSEQQICEFHNDLQDGNFVVILDGFDEVQSNYREKMKTDILNFIGLYDKNIFIVTSRPEDNFQNFVEFERYTIAPLKRVESYNLLRKHDKVDDLSEHLIKKLELQENKSVLEYLTTPLLVSLLYAAFNYKHTIPLKKHLFYEQVFDAFFERHDLTKEGAYIHEKKSLLDIYDFERVLRLLGLKCMTSQVVEFKNNELVALVDDSKPFFPDLIFRSEDFVSDLQYSVPLFCKDGIFLKWVHKSMQEFFAARFIYIDAKTEQDNLMSAILNSSKLSSYYNMLDIYYDIDNYGFNKNITLPLLQGFVEFYDNNYFELEGIPLELIKERLGLMYLRKAAIGYLSKMDATSDVFDKMSDWCKEKGFLYNNMHAYAIDSCEYCTANLMDPKQKLIDLIYNKMPELFKRVSDLFINQTPVGFSFKEPIIISGVKDFSDTIERYRCCNFCLTHTSSITSYYLDYDAVKIGIERIKANIVAKEKTSLLSSIF